jgi:hypothetical protein
MTDPSERPPSNLWSSPSTSTSREDVEKVKDALAGLKLTPTQLADRRKASAERLKPFKTGVTSATLASRMD